MRSIIRVGRAGKGDPTCRPTRGTKLEQVDAPPDPADEVVAAFLDGTLQAGTNVCDH